MSRRENLSNNIWCLNITFKPEWRSLCFRNSFFMAPAMVLEIFYSSVLSIEISSMLQWTILASTGHFFSFDCHGQLALYSTGEWTCWWLLHNMGPRTENRKTRSSLEHSTDHWDCSKHINPCVAVSHISLLYYITYGYLNQPFIINFGIYAFTILAFNSFWDHCMGKVMPS